MLKEKAVVDLIWVLASIWVARLWLWPLWLWLWVARCWLSGFDLGSGYCSRERGEDSGFVTVVSRERRRWWLYASGGRWGGFRWVREGETTKRRIFVVSFSAESGRQIEREGRGEREEKMGECLRETEYENGNGLSFGVSVSFKWRSL
ncbi:hypothetical protein CFOL_v3_34189, partial [Cephalotus follicularis]